jgi:hypothetical protein
MRLRLVRKSCRRAGPAPDADRGGARQPDSDAEEEFEEALELVGDTLAREDWERHRLAGRTERVEDLLLRLDF